MHCFYYNVSLTFSMSRRLERLMRQYLTISTTLDLGTVCILLPCILSSIALVVLAYWQVRPF